jgi:hypothetical protein
VLPVKRINRSLLMRHEYLTRSLVELMQVRKTSSGADGVLHHPPEAFDGVEGMSAVGWQEMEAQRAVVVIEGRVELVRSVDPAPIDDHHDLLLSFPEGRHHLGDILAQLLRIKVRDDFREDFGGAIVGFQALLEVNLRLATTDYLSNGYHGL